MPNPYKATSAYDYPLLIKHLLHTPLANYPEREIVYADRSRITYRTFGERIHRLANVLAESGVGQGDTVAIMDWDSNRYLECFFAVPMMGAVLHTINVRLAPEQILYTINHAADDVILVHADFIPLVEEIAERFDRQVGIIAMSDGDSVDTRIETLGEYENLMGRVNMGFDFPDFDEQTRATTFYTTGTTGDPKGVYYSHRQLVLHTLGATAGLASAAGQGWLRRDDVYMPITPMFHVHGWGIPYVATLMGIKQVYPGRYASDKLLQLIGRERVTFSHCVPTILHMLLSDPLSAEIDLSRWRVIIGGSALPRGLAATALDLGIDVFSAYGMSETCPFVSTAQLDPEMLERGREKQLDYRCKTGRAAPMVQLRVVDENMNDVPHDGKTTGEVVVRTPWLTQGYLKDRNKSEELWRGGYLHTGDIGHMDSEGYLKITDRVKDVIKSGGEWISSLALEDIVSCHPGVCEVAAIGIPHEKWGERPMVLIVLAEDAPGKVSAERIKRHVRQSVEAGEISNWAVPDRVEFVEAIAKTSVGKTDKKLLRQRYGANDADGPVG